MSEACGDAFQIMLSQEELTAVDDFRFQTRMPSRAAAVRELLKRGLAAEGFEIAVTGMKSQSFGVLGRMRQLPNFGLDRWRADLTGVRSSFGGNFHSRSRRHHFVDSTNGSRALSAPTHNQGEPRD